MRGRLLGAVGKCLSIGVGHDAVEPIAGCRNPVENHQTEGFEVHYKATDKMDHSKKEGRTDGLVAFHFSAGVLDRNE